MTVMQSTPPLVAAPKRARLTDIDAAKGLGMLLVVYGHLVQAGSTGESAWYATTRTAIYAFHMPFFMFLSGFVFFLTGAHEALGRNYRRFVTARVDRLMVPFLVFGILVVVGKYYAARFGQVFDAVTNIWSGVWDVVSNTPDNPSISIWYLLVLCAYCIGVPPLWRAVGGRFAILLPLAAILYFIPFTERFYVGRIAHFFLFFAVGGWIAIHRDHYYAMLRRYWWAIFALFAALVIFATPGKYALLYCGLLSGPALHGLMIGTGLSTSPVFIRIGKMSMAIYLMNTIFIGVAKLIWLRVFPAIGPWNVPFIATLMAVGTIAPIIVRAFVERVAILAWARRYIE